MTSSATHLRVEHLGDAVLGLGERAPRLSWRLPLGASAQVAYRIDADGWRSRRVESTEHVLVPWGGPPVGSRARVDWRVKVWTDLGEHDWSDVAWFETGLLAPGDWSATWIEPDEPERRADGDRPAYVLRRTFELHDPGPARLYATAHGIYETFLNGQRVGDLELTPGFTSYWANLHVQTYDVGDLLLPGANVWEVVLSDGWYRGRFGFTQQADSYGEHVAFLGQLHVGDELVVTGPEWESSSGAIVAADLMAGQREDHRLEPSSWRPVVVAAHDLDRLTTSPAPPTRRVQSLRPAAVTRLPGGAQVVDLGQNINGWVRLRDLGPGGTAVTLTHGEALDADGDVTQEHLGAFDLLSQEPLAVGQIDHVVSAGAPGEVFEPRHTTHGFQYVRIEGHPERLTPDDVDGVVVHTDLRRTGWFRCSDPRLDRLHEIVDWSFRGNACEVPTDCPQRERAGWTGDWQVFLPAATSLYDVAGFSLKWLRDLAVDQRPDGCILNFAPDPARPKAMAADVPLWKEMSGSSGWGDAVVMVPWELWRAYGDRDVLRELWPAIVGWVDYAADAARTKRHPSREARRPEPAPHEAYLWDGGFHWGEWHEPGMGEDQTFWTADQGAVGTAFLHHSAALAARIAWLLDDDTTATRFEALAAKVLDAWRTEFIAGDGTLHPDTQATHVRALAFGLVPDELRPQTVARLVRLIRDAGTHLGTGFLATPYLLPVLADAGHLDLAYEVLLQDTPPSWLAMVARGATTVWEDWEGIAADGTPKASLNHYSKGAVISFLHTHVAGIQLIEPGFRRFRVAPQLGGGLTWAEAVHDSPYGRIESSWRIDGEVVHLTVTVPPGTSAEVVLPDGARHEQAPGTGSYQSKGG
jgi:alpha-L-rhamnosidase